VAVRVATTRILRLAAASLRAGFDSLSLVLLVAPAGTEKRADPSVSFLLADAPARGTSTLDAVTRRIRPTQLPVTPAGHVIGTRMNLPRLTTRTRTFSLSPVKANGTTVVNDWSPPATGPNRLAATSR
jgi:acyl-homoserine lactone acylase PvdQ